MPEDVGLRAKIEGAGQFKRDAEQINRLMAQMGQQSVRTAQMSQQAGHSVQGLGNAFGSAGRGVSGLLGSLSQIGLAIFGVQQLARTLQGLGNAALGASADWEQYTIQMTTMLRSEDKAKAKMEELSQFARKTPFTLPTIMEATQQILAYGFAIEDVIPMMQIVGDTAAGLGPEKFGRIIMALGQIRAAERVTGMEMRQLTEAGIPAWQILADSIGISTKKLKELVESGAVPADQAVQALLQGMQKQFGGLGEAQAKSLKGIVSNFEDWQFRAKTILMDNVFEVVKDQAADLLAYLDTPEMEQRLAEWGQSLGEGAKDFVENTLPDLIAGIQEFASTDFKPMIEDTKAVLGALRDVAQFLGRLIGPTTAEEELNARLETLNQERESLLAHLDELNKQLEYGWPFDELAKQNLITTEWQLEVNRQSIEHAERELNRIKTFVATNPLTWDVEIGPFAGVNNILGMPLMTEAAGASTAAGPIKGLTDTIKKLSATKTTLGPSIDWSNLVGNTTGANTALRTMQRELQRIQKELSATQDQIGKLANARLPGMQAAEDEIFELEQAAKRARLAELGIADAAKDTNQEIGATFDILTAQQRELAEGIPVALQQYEWEQEQARVRAEEAARRAREATADQGETEYERIQKLIEAKQLEYDLKYAPDIRKIQEFNETLTGANQETPVDVVLAKLPELIMQEQTLQDQVEAQQAAIEAQQDSATSIASTRAAQAAIEPTITTSMEEQAAKALEMVNNYRDIWAYTQQIAGLLGGVKVPESYAASDVGASIPQLAEGGSVLGAGWAIVGEKGPELAHLPAGASVYSNAAMQRVLPAGMVNNNQTNNYGQNQFNVYDAQRPFDAVDAIKREMAFKRITAGRS